MPNKPCYFISMSEKILLLGKKSYKKLIFIWSGILAFILNLFGCDLTEPLGYSPPFFVDFEATGTVLDSVTLLPVKGVEVSVHRVHEEQYVNESNSANSDITDENGDFELDADGITIQEFIVYFHDTDPEADGNYADKYVKIEIPMDRANHIVDLETELSKVDE